MSNYSKLILITLIISIISKDLKEGDTHIKKITVTEDLTADKLGNTGIFVLATPFLTNLVEVTCYEQIMPYLSEGEGSVGTAVNIHHMKATPVGMEVTCKSTIIESDGRRIVFNVECHDEIDTVAEAQHERFIINKDKFLQKVNAKVNMIKK